jgi:organic radical activating enzyme
MIYEVILTYNCNWNCEYCCVNTHENKLNYEDALKKLEIIEEDSTVILSGGELGTLPKDKVINFINLLQNKNCKLHLNTNGLFLRKYEDLLTNFEEINYHCSQDLDITDEIIILNKKINYILIVHDLNIHKLQQFLEKNKDLKFCIYPASTPSTGIKNAPELSSINKFKILKQFNSRLTKKSIKRLINEDFSKITFL